MAAEDAIMDLEDREITFEPPEVLDVLLNANDRSRYRDLKNMEIRGQIEIIDEETVQNPRAFDREGNEVAPAELIKIVYYVTISKTLIEEDTDTSI